MMGIWELVAAFLVADVYLLYRWWSGRPSREHQTRLELMDDLLPSKRKGTK